MRIRQLNLIAFGHFTGTSIPLNANSAGIDLIYGPNEAGKSTTLRAVQCLLFGFPTRTNDSFLHANPKLRVGATLGLTDGSTFEVVRRKGNVKTLRDQNDDGVVDDAKLAELLGPLESESFRSRFALDGDELVRGGKAIVSGHGDLAQALFAAASGGRQLDVLRNQLEETAAELFKERASKPAINVGVKEVGDLDRQIREASLAPTEWTQTREELDDLEERREAISSELSELNVEIKRRERFRDALPSITRRRAAQEKLERLHDVPLLSEDFSERRSSAVAALSRLQQQIRTAEADLETRSEQLDKLDVSDELLSHDATIRELRDDVRRIRELRNSFGDRKRDIAQWQSRAAECLRELRWTDAESLPESMRPASTQSVRLDRLRSEFQTLQEKQRGLAKREADQKAALQRVEEDLVATPAFEDYSDLKRAVELARQAGPLEKQRNEAKGEQQRIADALERELSGLALWSGTVDELERVAVPLDETMQRFEREFTHLEQNESDANRELARLDRDIATANSQLEQLTAERDVPSEQSLNDARTLRDRGWQLVAQRLTDESDSSGGGSSAELTDDEAAFVAGAMPALSSPTQGDLLAAYENCVRQVDEIGDRLRREAELVAQTLTLRGRLQELQRDRDTHSERLADTERRLAELTGQWQDEWSPLQIEPRSPREMQEWTQRRQAILERAQNASLAVQKVEQLNQQIEEECRRLNHVLSTDESAATSLAGLLQTATDEFDTRLNAEAEHRRLSEALKNEQAARRQLRLEQQEAERELADWQSRWQTVLEELGAPNETTPDVAVDRLQVLTDWFAAQDEIAKLTADDQQAREQFDAFNQRAAGLLERLAPDLLPAADLTAAVEELDSLRETNQQRATQHDVAAKELEDREASLDAAQRELVETEAQLQTLCVEARVSSSDELPEVERQAEEKRRTEERFNEASEALAGFSGGRTLDEFAEEAAALTQEQLDVEITERAGRRDELQTELNELLGRRGELNEKLSGWTGKSLAAQANEDREGELATLRSNAEEYARLAIVSELLKQTGERYREKHQGPVLGRASELFRELTCGAFSGIQTDYDDKGTPIIVGMRSTSTDSDAHSGSERVDITGMSEGTCDQLYLALRLASLDEYLSQHDPVPLLIDDLLIRFDDARSAATLRVLEAVSQHTQVIVFTHHEHVVELAEKTLDTSLLHVHRLESRA